MAQLQSTNITGSLTVTGSGTLLDLNSTTGSAVVRINAEENQQDTILELTEVDRSAGGVLTYDSLDFYLGTKQTNTTTNSIKLDRGTSQIELLQSTLLRTAKTFTVDVDNETTYTPFLLRDENSLYPIFSLTNTGNPNNVIQLISTGSALFVGANDLSDNYALKVQNNSGIDILTVENDGKVGINVSNPSYDLELPTSATVKIGNLIIDANGNSGAGTQMLSGGNEITIGSALIPQPTGYDLGKSGRVWGSLYMRGDIYGSLGGTSTPDYWGFLATDGYRDDSHYSYLPPLVSFAIGNTPSTYRGYFGIIQPSGSDNLNTDAATKFGLFVIGPGGRTILGKTQYNRTNDSIPKDKMFTIYDGETSTDELFYIMTGSGDTYLKGSLTASGLNYPTTDGIDRQVLKTDGLGNLSFGYAENVEIAVKNVSGGEIPKGTPCYITASGTQGNTAGIIPADAGNPNLMPAGLIAGETLAAEAEGVGLVNGFIQGVDTSLFSSGDTVYIAVGGGYTNVKPTGSGVFIQKLGNVEKVGSNGSGVINGPGYYNDLPNWETGKVMVGTATYPATSSVVHIDEANGRVGIGTDSPTQLLTIEGNNRIAFKGVDTGTPRDAYIYTNQSDNLFIEPNLGSGKTLTLGSAYWTITYNASSAQYDHNLHSFRNVNNQEFVRFDGIDKRVGIGTTSLSASLHVKAPNNLDDNYAVRVDSSTTDNIFVVENNGKVGVGRDPNFYTPEGSVTAHGIFYSGTGGSVTQPAFYIGSNQGGAGRGFYVIDSGIGVSVNNAASYGFYGSNSTSISGPSSFGIGITTPTALLDIKYANTAPAAQGRDLLRISGSADAEHPEVFFISGSGKVGIGTWSPQEKLHVSGNLKIEGVVTGSLSIEGSGSTIFEVNGSEGQLFSITDSLSGSLFAVSDVSGLPILEVFSDDRVVAGAFNNEALVISGSHTTLKDTVISGSFLGSVTDITPTNQTASLDCSLGNFFTLTLSSSADTFLTASNIQPGQSINLRITQPATSGSLSYGPEFKFPNGAPYAVSATSSVEDILSFIAFDASSLYGSSLKNFQ